MNKSSGLVLTKLMHTAKKNNFLYYQFLAIIF